MHLRIRNTLSGKIEDFKPVDCNNVRMYVCGPTVYDRAHLGNARPAVVFDVLYRILKKLYSNVTYVRNITDVDDKIYARAIEKGISITDLTEETTRMYHSDTEALNVLLPDAEPKATDHIKEMIDLISVLIESKHAYVSNNHVYFDVSSFRDYGKLSRKNTDELLSGARVDISEHKKSSLDFVLWKPTDENFKVGWKSPWGIGRPGWHIECSAMSLKYLGEFFDIHGGGIDLIFPHHENEIAQSCAISGRQSMAKYWIHNGHLTVDGEKMSKSLGNFFTVHELLEKYDGEVIRLSLLMSNYSSPLNFSYSLLEQAKNMLDRWYNSIKNIRVIDHFDTISGEVFEAL
ncbi:MAG: cysteine--tRNA ligase, partial [Holosporales bacterium]|nr:cysteine--tRNA ligase [Holosporales bacterium]